MDSHIRACEKIDIMAGWAQQRLFSPAPLADMATLSGSLAKARLREKDRMRGNMPCFPRYYPYPDRKRSGLSQGDTRFTHFGGPIPV
jgi:hypothetical protein